MADDALFAEAPEEVQRYFRARRLRPSFDWRDVAPEEHAFGFTAAKTTVHDVLADLHSAVGEAIIRRVPLEEFTARLTPILQEKGWWGRQLATDPLNGEQTVVQLGSPRRLRTIYWANTRTAHAAGEWERTQRTKAFLPYLLYTQSSAERRRLEHEGWVGTVLPVDDPWWDTHYPPNGWGCQCGVRQISGREARERGWKEGTASPAIVTRAWRNRRTGETVQVPVGIDPGWETNPGRARGRNVTAFLTGQVEAMPAERRRIAIEDIVGSALMRALAERRLPAGSFLPVAQLPENAAAAIGARTRTVRLSADSVGHIVSERADRGLTVDDFRQALTVVARPEAMILQGAALAMLGLVDGQWWRVAVKPAAAGAEIWLVSFHRKSLRSAEEMIGRARRNGRLVE